LLAPSAQAAPAPPYGNLNNTEKFYCAIRYSDCRAGQDAAKWALDVTVWKFGEQGHNNMADAFRHCAWNGAMAQRMGSGRAANIANNHEKSEGQPPGEKKMDLANNSVGRTLGVKSNREGGGDTWGWVLSKCEGLARDYKLYGLDGRRGAY
jgi:hypothetical protein